MTSKRELLDAIDKLNAKVIDLHREAADLRATIYRADINMISARKRIAELEAKLTEESARVIRMGEYNDAKDAELVRLRQTYDDVRELGRTLAQQAGEAQSATRQIIDESNRLRDLIAGERDAALEANDILAAVGDRLIPNDKSLARREWEIAKTGRNPRNAKGQLVKVDL